MIFYFVFKFIRFAFIWFSSIDAAKKMQMKEQRNATMILENIQIGYSSKKQHSSNFGVLVFGNK